ncbi:hypothetical protein C6497_02480 [Candidatus Poribacteria bacterium]|nr:MAG: hypothetical protein C6497_02480 [Candidatus Poribacteria bacterium]
MDTTVIPFRGLRYNPKKVGNIVDVIAPPYDVIKPDEQRELEQRHPANIIRLILSQPNKNDNDKDNQYTRAAQLLNQWIDDSILVRDSEPTYYIYDQSFHAPDGRDYSRRALIANVKLEPFENRVIFPHEKTHAGPKIDRLNLMRTCHANLSPIFLLYQDSDGEIEEIMHLFTQENMPDVDCPEVFGSTHRIWTLKHLQSNEKIKSLFKTKPLLIADGHHRYETALTFRQEMEQKGLGTDFNGYDYMMMNLVRMESSGLAVLAIHRLLSNLSAVQIENAMKYIYEDFDVHQMDNLSSLMVKLEELKGKSSVFGLYTSDKKYKLLIPTDNTERLDVSIVQDTIINGLFKIENLAEHISYTAYTEDAINHVNESSGRVAILMNPTPVEQVLDVAMAGSIMPQKSTYFYPKMATGLILNLLNQ